METMIAVAASFFCAALSAMGMGGGGIFLLYLVSFAGVEQIAAQGMNLLFFIPVAGVSLLFHVKNKLVDFKAILLPLLIGFAGVYFGQLLAGAVSPQLLSKAFAVLLLIIGVREIAASFKKEEKQSRPRTGRRL